MQDRENRPHGFEDFPYLMNVVAGCYSILSAK